MAHRRSHRRELPEPWPAYTALVRDASYRITDADIAHLTAAGRTEDEVYEMTVAAAVGSALRSYDAGLRGQREAMGQNGQR